MQTLTTPQQLIDLAKGIYAAFSRGDIPFILTNLTEDVQWISRGDSAIPWNGEYKGREGAAAFFQTINDNCETLGFEPLEFIAQNDTIVTIGTFSCRANSTGKTGTLRWVFIWKVRDGKVWSYEQFQDAAFGEVFRA